MLNLIAWNIIVLTFKLRTSVEVNFLKWKRFCMLNWFVWNRTVFDNVTVFTLYWIDRSRLYWFVWIRTVWKKKWLLNCVFILNRILWNTAVYLNKNGLALNNRKWLIFACSFVWALWYNLNKQISKHIPFQEYYRVTYKCLYLQWDFCCIAPFQGRSRSSVILLVIFIDLCALFFVFSSQHPLCFSFLSTFACYRSFLTFPLSLISRQGFVFLLIFLGEKTVLSQVNFTLISPLIHWCYLLGSFVIICLSFQFVTDFCLVLFPEEC